MRQTDKLTGCDCANPPPTPGTTGSWAVSVSCPWHNSGDHEATNPEGEEQVPDTCYCGSTVFVDAVKVRSPARVCADCGRWWYAVEQKPSDVPADLLPYATEAEAARYRAAAAAVLGLGSDERTVSERWSGPDAEALHIAENPPNVIQRDLPEKWEARRLAHQLARVRSMHGTYYRCCPGRSRTEDSAPHASDCPLVSILAGTPAGAELEVSGVE